MNGDDVTYFVSFEVENIPKETNKFIDKKNLTMNAYRIQENDSIMCQYFCFGFTDYMVEATRYNFFSPNEY